MSYVALYRKFRPTTFEEVKGQDAIVTTLRNQIAADHIPHAYLFCGTRGTGKTTVAKILARAVNCEKPVNGGPCNECAACREILAGTSLNVVEIDAASNNGVDNIREIIDQVQYRPTRGRYKVYIIDEVHMLSAGAFNALLKTLEEPPSYVIFILATTEVSRLPLTILSRCQRYDFRRIEADTMVMRMQELLAAEGVRAEEKALRYIARSADGAMRDALSLLDQCMAFYLGQELTYEKVLSVLGAVDTEVFRSLLASLLKGDTAGSIAQFEQVISKGREIGQFLADFVWYLRNLLLIRTSGDSAADLIDASAEQLESMRETAQKCPPDSLMRMIRILSDLSNQMRFAANRRTLTEMALIRISKPQSEGTTDALLARMRQLEEEMERMKNDPGLLAVAAMNPAAGELSAQRPGGLVQAGGSGRNVPGGAQSGPDAEKEEEIVPAAPEDLQKIKSEWQKIVSDVQGGFKRQMLLEAVPKYNVRENDHKLYVEFQNENAERCAKDAALKENLAEIIARRYRIRADIEMHLASEPKSHLREIIVEEQLKRIHMPIEEVKED